MVGGNHAHGSAAAAAKDERREAGVQFNTQQIPSQQAQQQAASVVVVCFHACSATTLAHFTTLLCELNTRCHSQGKIKIVYFKKKSKYDDSFYSFGYQSVSESH